MTDKIAEFLAESKRLEEAVECSCWPTPEKYHFVHYGAIEPGSAWEQNPDCPVHGTSEWAEGARTALPKMRRALEAVLDVLEGRDAWEYIGEYGSYDVVSVDDVRDAIESALSEVAE